MAHTWNSPDGADAVVPETDRTSRKKAMYWLPLSSHWRPTRNEVASWKPEVVTWSSRQVAIVEYHVTGNAGTAALHFHLVVNAPARPCASRSVAGEKRHGNLSCEYAGDRHEERPSLHSAKPALHQVSKPFRACRHGFDPLAGERRQLRTHSGCWAAC
jgi:hypothetical protein